MHGVRVTTARASKTQSGRSERLFKSVSGYRHAGASGIAALSDASIFAGQAFSALRPGVRFCVARTAFIQTLTHWPRPQAQTKLREKCDDEHSC